MCFMCILSIIDGYSDYIVGYALSNKLEKTLIKDPIKKAMAWAFIKKK